MHLQVVVSKKKSKSNKNNNKIKVKEPNMNDNRGYKNSVPKQQHSKIGTERSESTSNNNNNSTSNGAATAGAAATTATAGAGKHNNHHGGSGGGKKKKSNNNNNNNNNNKTKKTSNVPQQPQPTAVNVKDNHSAEHAPSNLPNANVTNNTTNADNINNNNDNNNDTHLKQSLHKGTLSVDYSNRMLDVKKNLRSNRKVLDDESKLGVGVAGVVSKRNDTALTTTASATATTLKPTRHSSRRNSRSSSSSSSSSSTSTVSGFGILKFFGVRHDNDHHHHVVKTEEERRQMEEERRRQHNPFLNRPAIAGIQRSSQTGFHHNNNTFGENNNHHRHRSSFTKGPLLMDGSSENNHHHHNSNNDNSNQDEQDNNSNNNNDDDDDDGLDDSKHYRKTLQEKYCPLPRPIQLLHNFCGIIVTNQSFQIFMVVLIMFNAMILGIATYDFDDDWIPELLDILDRVLLVVFSIELALQFGYCGYTLFLDGWLVFDTLTIVTSWWLEGVQVFRSFRIFRSFRLIVRLPLLKNLVLTVFHVMPRVYSILGLLCLILYIFGVLCTILFGDLYERNLTDQNYFGRLDYSIFTLFAFITLESWGDVVRQVAAVHKYYASIIFCTFIVVTGFIMYNLIVAVMCDSLLVVEAQGREMKRQKEMMHHMAIEEEERNLEEEMLKQRAIEKRRNSRVKGLVEDDPTLSSDESRFGGTQNERGEDDEEESVVEMRGHMCENCGYCSEIPAIPADIRRRHRERDRLMRENQERVLELKQQLNQLISAQQRVTSALQTVMLEIEAQRQNELATGDANYSILGLELTEHITNER